MASTNQRDEWIDTGHQSDNISQENEGSQNTTASAAIRQSIAGESRYRDARVPSDVAGQILHRIHEERKLQHEIAKAALVVEEHKLRMFDKIANEITNGEARELRFENWDWRLRGRNIRIAFSDEENQDARDVEAPIEVYHVRLLRNAEKNCSRLVVDFSTADTARIEARRAAAASREAILSQSADDLAEAAAASREVDVHEEFEDLADDAQRNLHLTREAEHLAYASAAAHDSAKFDGKSENLPDTASPRANTQHSIALPPGASARDTQGADDERDDESSHDNDDELVTPAATKSASSAHDKQLSPSQKRTASSAESAAAETARQVRELDTAPSENEESAVISDDHPSRERLLLAFLKRQGFVLGHVDPPFTIDALLRPGHVYREGTSRREHDYFYVDTDLESALTEFPDLREEFAAFVRAHGGSADTALAKEQKSAESSSRSRNSASTPQTQETAFDNRAARVLFLDMLGPLRCQDYVDYFVARGWALGSLQRRGGRDGSESEILIRPKHRFKVASSVRGQDFVGRENEAELREYILESAAATEDFGRFRIERADSGKRGVFSATTSPSHLPTFFAQLRSKNALKTSRMRLIRMDQRTL
ncbi:Hypothetical Protein FCC1311_040182 [Hondaea fermentalgiana]|uniref:Uncharacterized protein n=1 Tax=Hondaea fermentalgiana TaxID=2315210 RepID=A0A2R5GB31_9STRA|nr:Hypothetical Protein FCC1311_040182 [Hondaea fermentalgiana]|eukprot:GBG27795.1 Hypothetical Protein FCC1311_040182 [Hondaea fermentalgiana]